MSTSSTSPGNTAGEPARAGLPRGFMDCWGNLFSLRFAGLQELLLLILLANVARDGLATATQSFAAFRESDAFDPVAVGINRVGFAKVVPIDWVLSWNFNRVVGAIAFLSAVLWILKRGLPLTPLICVLAHGLHVSIAESIMHNYKHQELPGVALLILFAAFYIFRHNEIRHALEMRTFWRRPIYPAWVPALVIAYLGFQYTYSGLTKIWMGGLQVGDGISLQLLLSTRPLPDGGFPDFSQPILENRWLASVSLTAVVILETGAFFAFCFRWVRPIWAFGLFLFHGFVILTLAIPFKMHMAILGWFMLWGVRDLAVVLFGPRVTQPLSLVSCTRGGVLDRLIYPIDVLGILDCGAGPSDSALSPKVVTQ